nr:hypothetical protein [Luminiphilus sp.]
MNEEQTLAAGREDDTTDFGFTRVDRKAKAGMVSWSELQRVVSDFGWLWWASHAVRC